MTSSTKVLIAGARADGLVLALSLARRGVSFRIIDEADGPGEHSRAMVVQARTLEFYQQFGFADEVIAEGIVVPQLRMRVTDRGQRPREVLSLKFRDLGDGISPYPFALTYPQDDHGSWERSWMSWAFEWSGRRGLPHCRPSTSSG